MFFFPFLFPMLLLKPEVFISGVQSIRAKIVLCVSPLLQLTTLRGAILEDAIPSTARHGTARGLPLKEVLEYVIPELSIQCLRQASNSPKVPEQLLKLDEQGVCSTWPSF